MTSLLGDLLVEPARSYGCRCQAVHRLVVDGRLLLKLHLDAQCGQTWHLSTQLRSGERTGRRLLWSTTLLLPTLLSDSQVSISLVIHGLQWNVSGQVKAHVVLAQMGSRPITFLWLWLATDHEPHCWHVPINKLWRWTESTPQSGWWRSHMAGIYSDCSTREIIINCSNHIIT